MTLFRVLVVSWVMLAALCVWAWWIVRRWSRLWSTSLHTSVYVTIDGKPFVQSTLAELAAYVDAAGDGIVSTSAPPADRGDVVALTLLDGRPR